MTCHEVNSSASALVAPERVDRPRCLTPAATLPTKVHPHHRERLAVVYVRQSSQHQVLEHRESRERQYALVERAVELGWPADRVLVIDEDQGQSGKRADNRVGFQRLLVEVNLDHVGLILGLEMSRLARSNKDWHHLLEVCAIFRTLLADSDGLYDPNDPNDRMLLGLKGTISEVELHTLRNRLTQGILNKARRGEFFTSVAIGYVRLPDDELALDPDEQVQSVVRLIFDKFQELRSASGVLRYLATHGIRLGVRRRNARVTGPVGWNRPSYSTLLAMLHNPVYAGVYCRGRRTSDPRRKGPHFHAAVKRLPMDEWAIMLHDTVPAYITWQQYLANLETLKSNQARMERLGSARNGWALLPGLLRCGYCGSRMTVNYNRHKWIRYGCLRKLLAYSEKPCQFFDGECIDELVQKKVLSALEPAALELSIRAAEDIQQERDRLHRNWRQRLERARYEIERAQRQYDAVEPENRLVVRELEQRWEAAMRNGQQLEEEYDRFCQSQPQAISTDELDRIRSLSSDIPRIWRAKETSPQDRKTIIRQLIDRVVAKAEGEFIDLTIHWAGGYVSKHEVVQRVGRFDRLRDFDRLKQRVLELHFAGQSRKQIAAQLIEDGFRTPYGFNRFNKEVIRMFLRRYCRQELGPYRGAFREFLGPNEWLIADLSREVNVRHDILHSWRRRGWLRARQLRSDGGRFIFWADADELRRLRDLQAHCHRGVRYPIELLTPKPRSS